MYIYFQAMKIHSLFITINALLQAIVEMTRCAKHRDAPAAIVVGLIWLAVYAINAFSG